MGTPQGYLWTRPNNRFYKPRLRIGALSFTWTILASSLFYRSQSSNVCFWPTVVCPVLIVLFIYWVFKRRRKTKQCPDCAELVQMDAQICRFCRHKFPALRPEPPAPPKLYTYQLRSISDKKFHGVRKLTDEAAKRENAKLLREGQDLRWC
jgi:hypothetical protein